MEKISVCGLDNCNNNSNHHNNCENYIAERLLKIDKFTLIKLYHNLCSEYKIDKIESVTVIDGVSTQDILFDRILLELFGCNNLAKIINETKILNGNILTDKSVSELLIEKNIKIGQILYGYKENFLKLLQTCREICKECNTDIFSNILVRIDAIYQISGAKI